MSTQPYLNPLPDDKNLGLPKLKAFADDKLNVKLNVARNVKVVFCRIENIVGKEENAGYQNFLLFPQCFQMFFPQVRQTSSLRGKGLNLFSRYFTKIFFNSSVYNSNLLEWESSFYNTNVHCKILGSKDFLGLSKWTICTYK